MLKNFIHPKHDDMTVELQGLVFFFIILIKIICR